MSHETNTIGPVLLNTHPDIGELNRMFASVLAGPQYPESPLSQTDLRHRQTFEEVRQQFIDVGAEQTQTRSLEDGASDEWVDEQEYSHSTRVIELVGALAVKGELETQEGRIAKETLRERFESSVIEMLHTDQEFRDKLEINRERSHIVRDNQIMALDGKTSMARITRRGARSAANAAESEESMRPIAERCAADERVVERVEKLPIGGFMVGLSVDPKEAMARYGKKIYEDKGFREGLAFLQWYYRVDEHTLVAATYSVDQSDLATWREVWEESGGNIPEGEPTDIWLDHDIAGQCTLDEARKFVRRLRERFYEKRGITAKRYSVDEFMAINQSACDEMFESIYMNLAVASGTGQLNNTLTKFVDGLLSGAHDLNEDVQQQLFRIQRIKTLERSGIALLEQLSRYAITERLRSGLPLLGRQERPLVQNFFIAPSGMVQQATQADHIAFSLAGNVLSGARAGRTYGGCTKSIDLRNPNKAFDDMLRPQDAFGGLDGQSDSDRDGSTELEEDDGLGPRMFRCTEGHINVRPKGKLLTECQTKPCKKGSVGC